MLLRHSFWLLHYFYIVQKGCYIYGDSQLVVNQVNDTYNTKDEKLKSYKIVVVELLDEFDR